MTPSCRACREICASSGACPTCPGRAQRDPGPQGQTRKVHSLMLLGPGSRFGYASASAGTRKVVTLYSLPRSRASQRLHQIGRNREHDGRGALTGDALQRREVAQLHRLRSGRENRPGLSEFLRSLELALGVDDLGAADALGLRLAGDRPHHGLVEVDLLKLDNRDLDPPGLGLLVEDAPDVGVELLALPQHLVEIMLAEHGAQRSLRQLAGRLPEMLDLDDRLLRIDHAEI